MNFEACFQLGYVVKVHGIKGEIQIFLDVDIPSNYRNLESVFVDIDSKLVPFFVKSIQISGNKGILKLEEVGSIEEAEPLKHRSLYLPLERLPALPENQFYFHEIVGYFVMDKSEGQIGTVKEIYSLPQQDLIAVDHKNKEVLIPLNDDIVRLVDHNQKTLHVVLPEGLLQVYLED